jgi:hypothetical protein
VEADLAQLEKVRKEVKEIGDIAKQLGGIDLAQNKRKRGRPSKLTPQVVTKLEAAFNMGYNDTEAALYADISRKTLYEWLVDKPDFRYKINQARSQPNIRAKAVVVNAVNNGDVGAAKWWLERKAADEFSTKSHNDSDTPPELLEYINSLKGIVKVQETRIAHHYRTTIYRLREEERNTTKVSKNRNTKSEKVEQYTRLLSLSDAELSNHVAQEITATGQDIAGVRESVIDRVDYQSMYERELSKAKKWNDIE